MTTRSIQVILILLVSFNLNIAFAQESSSKESEAEKSSKHRIGPFIGYGLSPNLKGNFRMIPVLGLDYEYWFNERIALGLSNDLDLLGFTVETSEGLDLEREFALVFTANGVFKPVGEWIISLGGGIEVEQNESLGVFRLGTGWEFEVNSRLDLEPVIAWEMKGKATYHTINFGLVIGLNFRK